MQSSAQANDDPTSAAEQALTAMRRPTPGAFDEWRGAAAGAQAPAAAPAPDAGPSPHWQQFFDLLGDEGWRDLPARHARMRHRVQEDGATYNVYADGAQAERAWPLELLPAIVPADDWALIERGVAQRARLLEATLVDIYGPQQLLRDALLPASLIFAHPQYLRAAHDLLPEGSPRLHIVAMDLARTPQGEFRVLAQRVQAPSGLGYLLENRLIIAPQFREQFAAAHAQRLAASFRTLLDGLMRASPAGERSRIVLLTPGPWNETYFEQAFLARYLGITLVAGNDLTVRGESLFLKTLHGLEPVHVVLRRVDDEFLDPLELRADSELGVPGLLQAVRAGTVVVTNTPGAGVLESPGLSAFWPALSRRLLGENLQLHGYTSWWCGEAAVWQAQRDKLADYVVAPTFANAGFGPRAVATMGAEQQDQLRRRIDADPAAYTLQARVQPGETPVWVDGELQLRPAVLRVFAVADGSGGWRVLPGALTRVAGANPGAGAQQDPWLSMQHGSASVDTWVITRDPVDSSTLLPAPLSVSDLQGWRRSVTSRAAESLFWMGRYCERAENSLRLVRLTLTAMADASPAGLGWLSGLTRHHGLVGADVPGPALAPQVYELALMHGLRGNNGSATSVSHNLRCLRRSAYTLRERLSPEHWKLIEEVDAHFEQHLSAILGEGHVGGAGDEGGPPPSVSDVLGLLSRTSLHLAAITGQQTDQMTRDDGWRLMSVGRQLERLDMASHALAEGFTQRLHLVDDGLELMLELFDALLTYRAQFQGRREVLPMLHLLVFDTDNPRSLAWVARTMRDRLRKLASHDADWVRALTADISMPADWPLATLGETDEAGLHSALIAKLQDCKLMARELSDEIGHHLFSHVDSPARRVWQ